MTFAIDTGAPAAMTIADYVPDWFKDTIGEATEYRLSHDFAYHLIGDMKNPKTFKTVRKHLLQNWQFLRLLGEQQPDVFDEVLTAFSERALAFE